jgi:hypothetical protein
VSVSPEAEVDFNIKKEGKNDEPARVDSQCLPSFLNFLGHCFFNEASFVVALSNH